MRYAIISDIHSNLEALSTCLSFIPKLRIDKIICLGDIVGYNASPNECTQVISKLSSLEIIRGNHDRAVAFKDYHDFSRNASEAVRWTIMNLKNENEEYLKALDQGPKIIDNTFAICHGSTEDEDKYVVSAYTSRYDFEWLNDNNINLLFFGHTHQQVSYSIDEENNITELINAELIMGKDKKYMVNPGSIGQPRDNNPRASFAVYDSDEKQINIIRFEYKYHLTQEKILEAGLPRFLADRLELGR